MPPPGNSHAEQNWGFLVNTLLQLLLSSASGDSTLDPHRGSTLRPRWTFVPHTRVYGTKQIPGYAPEYRNLPW